MDLATSFERFGVALLVGLLIGLERESSKAQGQEITAGVRTLAIVAVVGGVAGYFHALGSTWPLLAGLVAVAALFTTAYAITAGRGAQQGLTSEFAGLLVYLIGALVVAGEVHLGVALGIALAVLLATKPPLHQLAGHILRRDIVAALKFAVVSVIILPLLPDRTFGPYDVLNPRLIWLMVVFISGISFLGYVLIKILGSKRGISLTGLLGGLVSSTALTLSFSQRGREVPALALPLTLAILIASSTMFPRVLLAAAVLDASLVHWLAVPLGIATLTGILLAALLYRSAAREPVEQVAFANPFALGPAIKFGLLFGLILLVSKAAQVLAGDAGVYLAAVVGGFADVDPITLSMARLSAGGDVARPVAALAILIAVLCNTLLKAGIAMVLGSPAMRRHLAWTFGVLAVVVAVAAVVLPRVPVG
ncbi:MAG: MgtC/SapB family protein [Candidatus Eiseniibacteriota bacterium]|jgi:uncharacterized membrane protein (DUF4010 family)